MVCDQDIRKKETLYDIFYYFKKKLFKNTSNPGIPFLSRSQKEALKIITFGLEQGKGFIALVGQEGVGKTTLLQVYLKRMEGSGQKTICLFNGNFSFIGLLKTIAQKLNLQIKNNEPSLLLDIRDALIKENEKGRNLVLLIDDAQNAPIEYLERLRLFTNLETPKRKLVHVVLVGQPELERKLNLQELRQLKQRIDINTTLSPLLKKESWNYLKFRLERVGRKPSSIFTQRAVDKIIRYSGGIPRIINIICSKALVISHASSEKRVSASIVKKVIENMDGKENRFNVGLFPTSIAVIFLGLSILGFFTFYNFLKARKDLPFSPLSGLEKPAHVFVADINNQDNPLAKPAKGILSQKILIPHSRKALLNQKTISKKSDDPFSIVNLQFINEKALPEKKKPEPEEGEEQFPVIKRVKKGDNLYRLILNIYGVSNQDLLEFVKKHNPKIKDNYGIQAGEKIIFPSWREKKEGSVLS